MGIVEEFANQNVLVLDGVANGQPKRLELVLGRAVLTVQANFSAWCRDVTMERCRQLAAMLPEDGRRTAIVHACDLVVKECGWGQPVAVAMMAEPIGMAKYLHLLLSDAQRQAVSVTDIADLVWAADSDEINRKLLEANGVSREDVLKAIPKAGGPGKTEPRTEPKSTGESSSATLPGVLSTSPPTSPA